jgi:hypothetical protein
MDDVGAKCDQHPGLAIERHADALPCGAIDNPVEGKIPTAVIAFARCVALLIEKKR